MRKKRIIKITPAETEFKVYKKKKQPEQWLFLYCYLSQLIYEWNTLKNNKTLTNKNQFHSQLTAVVVSMSITGPSATPNIFKHSANNSAVVFFVHFFTPCEYIEKNLYPEGHSHKSVSSLQFVGSGGTITSPNVTVRT